VTIIGTIVFLSRVGRKSQA